MRLLHYSAEPFQFDPERVYGEPSYGFKPVGLWVSVEGDQDWKSWCDSESFGDTTHATEVRLRPDANVLLIDSVEKLDAFNERFRLATDNEIRRNIAWDKVKALYDGMIIAPYQWERRLEFMWYYGWDCASGVIWNLSAIAGVNACHDIHESHS